MTFEKQVKEAKEKQLVNRFIRDITFVILGIVFLLISILSAYKDSKKDINKENKTTAVNKENR